MFEEEQVIIDMEKEGLSDPMQVVGVIKHKYIRRWRGKDGKWEYEYTRHENPRSDQRQETYDENQKRKRDAQMLNQAQELMDEGMSKKEVKQHFKDMLTDKAYSRIEPVIEKMTPSRNHKPYNEEAFEKGKKAAEKLAEKGYSHEDIRDELEAKSYGKKITDAEIDYIATQAIKRRKKR